VAAPGVREVGYVSRGVGFCARGQAIAPSSLPGKWLEPISKSPEEDNEAGELNEAKEVLWMIFPSDEDPALPLDPGKEAFDQPAPQEASQAAPVLRRRFRSVRAVRRDHLDAILT
jgi:hypothetical protein